MPDGTLPARPSPAHRIGLALLTTGWFLLLCFYLFRNIHKLTGGHFVYALDDPYIHLALAEQIAHGHYGINAVEYTSPSSSLLWPLLLVLGANTPIHVYVPLLLNLLFGSIAAFLLGWHVATWPPQVDNQGRMRLWKQAFTAMLLVFVANLAGLTYVGMEHVLHVLLAICCAIGISKALSGEQIPGWCLAAAALAPSVRYEDLTLTLAISVALVALGRWRGAIVLFVVSLLPLAGFSVFLRSKGLPALPMSVLVKGDAYAHASLVHKVVGLILGSIRTAVPDPEHYPIAVLTFLFLGLAWKAPTRQRRILFAGVAALGTLQLLSGRFGWFFRYEVYAGIFLTLVCLRVLAERPRFLFGFFTSAPFLCFFLHPGHWPYLHRGP